MQYQTLGMRRGKALAWLRRHWATRNRKFAILYRGSSAHDVCLENCGMFWNSRSQILLSAAGDCIKDDSYLSSIVSGHFMKTTCNSLCSQLGLFGIQKGSLNGLFEE
jgi:hypothetical protein